MAPPLDPNVLRSALVSRGAGWAEVEHHASIGSTNARATQLGRPWVVVAADHQSAGRGRLARRWDAPPGRSVAVSATVPVPASGAGWLPLLTGLAVTEAVEATTSLSAELKWPNDVLLPSDDDRKVSGILCEVVVTRAGPLVVIGAGINVSQSRAQLPVDTATSLLLAGAHVTESTGTDLVVAYLQRLADRYAALVAAPVSGGALAVLAAEYRTRCSTLGRRVRLTRVGTDGAIDVVGVAVDVDAEGRLVIDGPGGLTAWAAGDVVHARLDG
ncbi:MAG: biotin--[acetyl-CoA-carboxylase] ligase [Actinomycetota bacterium]|nr:biotin--[acetyl-CoA-carboxylase] ligase [Actinomycetota bacterium]